MGAVLEALRTAGTGAASRSSVVRAFFKLSNFPTALGPLSINSSTGDVQGSAPYVISRVRGGTVVAYQAEQG
jgi:hypothetical protein